MVSPVQMMGAVASLLVILMIVLLAMTAAGGDVAFKLCPQPETSLVFERLRDLPWRYDAASFSGCGGLLVNHEGNIALVDGRLYEGSASLAGVACGTNGNLGWVYDGPLAFDSAPTGTLTTVELRGRRWETLRRYESANGPQGGAWLAASSTFAFLSGTGFQTRTLGGRTETASGPSLHTPHRVWGTEEGALLITELEDTFYLWRVLGTGMTPAGGIALPDDAQPSWVCGASQVAVVQGDTAALVYAFDEGSGTWSLSQTIAGTSARSNDDGSVLAVRVDDDTTHVFELVNGLYSGGTSVVIADSIIGLNGHWLAGPHSLYTSGGGVISDR